MTGLIFGVVAVACLVYLLPAFLSRRDPVVEQGQGSLDDFARAMIVIRRASDPFDVDNDPDLELSTPLMREAARFEIRRSALTAARRRRIGLLVHLGLVVAGTVSYFVWSLPWWVLLIGPVLLAIWIVVSRWSVVVVNRRLEAITQRVRQAWEEQTVTLQADDSLIDHNEMSIEISAPIGRTLGSLLDPIPVAPATYVSKPLMPRSVRTIDLSAPIGFSQPPLPITAEGPVDEQGRAALDRAPGPGQLPLPGAEDTGDLPRAVGE